AGREITRIRGAFDLNQLSDLGKVSGIRRDIVEIDTGWSILHYGGIELGQGAGDDPTNQDVAASGGFLPAEAMDLFGAGQGWRIRAGQCSSPVIKGGRPRQDHGEQDRASAELEDTEGHGHQAG